MRREECETEDDVRKTNNTTKDFYNKFKLLTIISI